MNELARSFTRLYWSALFLSLPKLGPEAILLHIIIIILKATVNDPWVLQINLNMYFSWQVVEVANLMSRTGYPPFSFGKKTTCLSLKVKN